MLEIRRVLVPTDFSPHAEPALKYGPAWPRSSAPNYCCCTSFKICH